jgi:hypothetical protein
MENPKLSPVFMRVSLKRGEVNPSRHLLVMLPVPISRMRKIRLDSIPFAGVGAFVSFTPPYAVKQRIHFFRFSLHP